jgi:branched-subunit amino acid ABC-type transport system permease component
MNFAAGSVYLLGAYFATVLMGYFVASVGGWVLALLVVPLGAAVAGALVEAVLLRRTYARNDENQQFMLTLALSYIVTGLIIIGFGTRFRSVAMPHLFDGNWNVGGAVLPKYTVVTIVVGLVVTAGIWALMYGTRVGLLTRAAANDRSMLAALGVDVGRLYTGVFAFGIALGALGGVLIAPVYAITTNLDAVVLVPAFIVVVTGGLGSMVGALVAAIVIGVAQSFVTFEQPTYSVLTPYVVMILVLAGRGLVSSGRLAIAGPLRARRVR